MSHQKRNCSAKMALVWALKGSIWLKTGTWSHTMARIAAAATPTKIACIGCPMPLSRKSSPIRRTMKYDRARSTAKTPACTIDDPESALTLPRTTAVFKNECRTNVSGSATASAAARPMPERSESAAKMSATPPSTNHSNGTSVKKLCSASTCPSYHACEACEATPWGF